MNLAALFVNVVDPPGAFQDAVLRVSDASCVLFVSWAPLTLSTFAEVNSHAGT